MCSFHISMHSKPSEIILEISKIQKPNKKTMEQENETEKRQLTIFLTQIKKEEREREKITV